MKAIEGFSRIALLGFFASHIPITLMVDGQASLFRFPYPQALTDLVAWYAATTRDPHFLGAPVFAPWFASMTTWEIVFQVPYFFAAVYMLSQTTKQTYPEWFRLYSILYGASTATTLIPILAVNLTNRDVAWLYRVGLSVVYLPYLVFPLWMVQKSWVPTKPIAFKPMTGLVFLSFFGFFASHIPVSLLLDGQVLFQSWSVWFPQPTRDFLAFYVSSVTDPVMTPPHAVWFRSVVLMELLFQVPFFVVALRFMTGRHVLWPAWFHSYTLCYSAQAFTVMLPIYATLFLEESSTDTLGIYLPYALFPLWSTALCIRASYPTTRTKTE